MRVVSNQPSPPIAVPSGRTYPIGVSSSSRAMTRISTFCMPGFSSKHEPLAITVPATFDEFSGVSMVASGLSRSRSTTRW